MQYNSLCPFGRYPKDLSQKQLTPDDKTWIVHQILAGKETPISLANKCNLSNRTVGSYVRKFKQGIPFNKSAGRPPLLSPISKQNIIKFLNESSFQVSSQSFEDKVNDEIKDHAASVNKSIYMVKNASKRTLGRIEKELDVKTGNAKMTTKAKEDMKENSKDRKRKSNVVAERLVLKIPRRQITIRS